MRFDIAHAPDLSSVMAAFTGTRNQPIQVELAVPSDKGDDFPKIKMSLLLDSIRRPDPLTQVVNFEGVVMGGLYEGRRFVGRYSKELALGIRERGYNPDEEFVEIFEVH